MNRYLRIFFILLGLLLILPGCNEEANIDEGSLGIGTGHTPKENGGQAGEERSNARPPNAGARKGVIKRVEIESPVDGVIVFQLFEPEQVLPGKRYPLILHGHGYGGSRQTEPTGLVGELINRGYYVISIDQRGFGESTGPVAGHGS